MTQGEERGKEEGEIIPRGEERGREYLRGEERGRVRQGEEGQNSPGGKREGEYPRK